MFCRTKDEKVRYGFYPKHTCADPVCRVGSPWWVLEINDPRHCLCSRCRVSWEADFATTGNGSAWKPRRLALQTRGSQFIVEGREALASSIQTIGDTVDAWGNTYSSVRISVVGFLWKPSSLARHFISSSARRRGLCLTKMLCCDTSMIVRGDEGLKVQVLEVPENLCTRIG
jgi:hypothetical protein